MYKACSEIIETLAFYPELINIDKQNLAWIIIGLLYKVILLYNLAPTAKTLIMQLPW